MAASRIADNLEPILFILKEYKTFFFSDYVQTSNSVFKIFVLRRAPNSRGE